MYVCVRAHTEKGKRTDALFVCEDIVGLTANNTAITNFSNCLQCALC